MFQKEFAKRLLDKKLNSINSLIKCFYSVELNFNVSKIAIVHHLKLTHRFLLFNKLKKKININEERERGGGGGGGGGEIFKRYIILLIKESHLKIY